MRRFTEANVFVPRKNGKTVIAAVIAIFMFIADGEPGAEVYTVLRTATRPMRYSAGVEDDSTAEGFKEWFGITIGKLSMYVLDEGSKFEKVIGNPGDGAVAALLYPRRVSRTTDSTSSTKRRRRA